jgi:hypothetical protein
LPLDPARELFEKSSLDSKNFNNLFYKDFQNLFRFLKILKKLFAKSFLSGVWGGAP